MISKFCYVKQSNTEFFVILTAIAVKIEISETWRYYSKVADSAGKTAIEITRPVIVEVGPAPPPRKGGGGGILVLLELLIALGELALGPAARRERQFEP